MACVWQYVIALICIVNATVILAETGEEHLEKPEGEGTKPEGEGGSERPSVKPEEAPQIEDTAEAEHSSGSLCTYCSYCKFCKLCDKDCPCSKTAKKPNCHMCKYCKYCNLCSAICDTVCLPGGFLDTISSKIWNSLPTFDSKMKHAVDEDIESVKDWIKEYL